MADRYQSMPSLISSLEFFPTRSTSPSRRRRLPTVSELFHGGAMAPPRLAVAAGLVEAGRQRCRLPVAHSLAARLEKRWGLPANA